MNKIVLSQALFHNKIIGDNIEKHYGSIGTIIAHEIGHMIDNYLCDIKNSCKNMLIIVNELRKTGK